MLVVGLQRFAGCYCGSNPTWGMASVSCEFCVLSDRSLCVGPITLPEESYRVWCVCLSVMLKFRKFINSTLQLRHSLQYNSSEATSLLVRQSPGILNCLPGAAFATLSLPHS